MTIFDVSLVIVSLFLSAVSLVVGLLSHYHTWLRNKESIDDRESELVQRFQDSHQKVTALEFIVKRVTVTDQSSYRYRIRKYVPFLRRLEGTTELILRSGGLTQRPVGPSRAVIDDGLTGFFDERPGDIPYAEHVNSDLVEGGYEIEIHVDSIEIEDINTVIDRIPLYFQHIIFAWPNGPLASG